MSSAEEEFVKTFPALDELVLHQVNPTPKEVAWLRTTHFENLAKALNDGEPLWETILMVWRLRWLEKDLEDNDEEFSRLWAEHLSAWLVSDVIEMSIKMMTDFREIDAPRRAMFQERISSLPGCSRLCRGRCCLGSYRSGKGSDLEDESLEETGPEETKRSPDYLRFRGRGGNREGRRQRTRHRGFRRGETILSGSEKEETSPGEVDSPARSRSSDQEGNPEGRKETSPGFAGQARRVLQKESEEDHRDAEEEREVRSEEAADP